MLEKLLFEKKYIPKPFLFLLKVFPRFFWEKSLRIIFSRNFFFWKPFSPENSFFEKNFFGKTFSNNFLFWEKFFLEFFAGKSFRDFFSGKFSSENFFRENFVEFFPKKYFLKQFFEKRSLQIFLRIFFSWLFSWDILWEPKTSQELLLFFHFILSNKYDKWTQKWNNHYVPLSFHSLLILMQSECNLNFSDLNHEILVVSCFHLSK